MSVGLAIRMTLAGSQEARDHRRSKSEGPRPNSRYHVSSSIYTIESMSPVDLAVVVPLLRPPKIV